MSFSVVSYVFSRTKRDPEGFFSVVESDGARKKKVRLPLLVLQTRSHMLAIMR